MLFPIGDDNIDRGHPPVFSYLFLAVNIAVFIFQAQLPEGKSASFVETYGAIPFEISQGVDWPTLLTSIFLHGSWMHLLGNMLYLWIFADNIEAVSGNLRFVFFYLIGVGASGAIAAVMGAYIVMFPGSRIRMLLLIFTFYLPAWVFLGVWFIQQISSGVSEMGAQLNGGVAWWAHIGGFVYGLLYGWMFRRRSSASET
jgi:membrane associated rhomboid family serine protease